MTDISTEMVIGKGTNEQEVKEEYLSFTGGIYAMQKHIADAVIAAEGTNILDLKRGDDSRSLDVLCPKELSDVISISFLFDEQNEKYIARNENGNDLISFN